MSRKNFTAAANAPPPSGTARRRGRSGEGTASLLAQLTDEQRVDDMLRTERAIDAAAENEPGPSPREGDLQP